ncbi:MAG: KOW domain-containing RNA-binding protein [Eubacteriales bacterium]
MEFEKGCVVKSTAGRDKGSLLLVLDVQQDRVLLCDGKERPLQRPKHKNPRHLEWTGISLNIEEVATNRALKKTLRQLSTECDGKTIGG